MSSTPPSTRGAKPTEIVARAFEALEIAAEHDPTVIEEAEQWRLQPGMDDPGLDDLTGLSFITIDNPDSQDLDQALLIEREGNHYRVRYALADAGHYVRPGTALFSAALARGTSYYTPLGSAPMLPRALSEDLVSLGANATRRSVVFDMSLDEHGNTLKATVRRALVRSRAKLTYAGVQTVLDAAAGQSAPEKAPQRPSASEAAANDPQIAQTLYLLREVGEKLSQLARQRGVIAFDRREAQLSVAGNPPRFVALERARLLVEEWNAQISLLCNSEGALLLAALDRHDDGLAETHGDESQADAHDEETKPPTVSGRAEDGNAIQSGPETLEPIYRVHAAPLSARLKELRRVLDEWVTTTGLSDSWRWQKSHSLAEYLDALPTDPRERGRVRAVQRQVLIRQRGSEFSAEPGRHHALATDHYARFSSPMREVVGIFTHLELLDALEGRGSANVALRDEVIAAANAAKRRQKALDKRIGLAVISDLLDADLARNEAPARAGVILGVRAASQRSDGHLYVGLDDLALDLKVQPGDLQRRHGTPYSLNDVSAKPTDTSKPIFMLGDAVSLRVVAFDEAQSRFALDLALKGDSARRERRRVRPA